MERYNPNYVGGDINVGANSIMQVAMRPRIARDPYATGVPGVFLSSSATPPGPGVHGMCGYGAAGSALKYLNGGALAQQVA
jgi:phytoene dehydrogenase-like protein